MPKVEIELEIYSGRPNPSWTVDGEQAAQLCRSIESLNVPASPTAEPSGLGYRGVILRVTKSPKDTTKTIRIFDGRAFVDTFPEGKVESWEDQNRALESQAVATGRNKVEQELLDFVLRQIH